MDKIINKVKMYINDNFPILIIIFISLILHIMSIRELGFNYSLNSDDLSYVISGVTFLKTGIITMHGVISAQIMPGMTFLIAFISLIMGTTIKLWIALKILWMLMGLLTIYVVYKTIRIYTNKYIAALPCLFFLAIDYIWMDNLILTETPFILLFSLLIYYSLRFSKGYNDKDYILIVFYYIVALFIRPNIAIFVLPLIIFLIMKKYDYKRLIKQCLIAGVALAAVIIPWTYRNYKVFNEFIPFTYGVGNPLLLGTYQGEGFPLDDALDYKKEVDEKLPKKIKNYLQNPKEKDYMKSYARLEYDKYKAQYRMKEWWKTNRISMLKSYLFHKPKINFYNYFYWHKTLGIEAYSLSIIRMVEIVLFAISSIIILIDKERIKEWVFIILVYFTQIALYSYTFAFSRYAISMFFMRYIIIGVGIDILYRNRRRKYENINNNTSI